MSQCVSDASATPLEQRSRSPNRRSRTLRCKRRVRCSYRPFRCAVDVLPPGSPARLGSGGVEGRLVRRPVAVAYPAASSVAGAPDELPWPGIGAGVRGAGQPGQHPRSSVSSLTSARWFPAGCGLSTAIVITRSFLLIFPVDRGLASYPARLPTPIPCELPAPAVRPAQGLMSDPGSAQVVSHHLDLRAICSAGRPVPRFSPGPPGRPPRPRTRTEQAARR